MNPIGILGGGQLARMLAMAAHPLGYLVSVLTPSAQDSAAQVVGKTVLGSLEDDRDLKRFLSDVHAVTFESEFVDTDRLARCLGPNTYVFPRLDVIARIQDRKSQKELLDHYKIPTSPWCPVDTPKDLETARAKFPKGFVLKQRRFGYDGYGTFITLDGQINESVFHKSNHGFIAEALVPFRRELAFSTVRSRDGQILHLPLVESVQKDARCFSIHGPMQHRGWRRVQKGIEAMLEDLDYVGILAIELFETTKGLIVNELAPRVHNSAHYSIDALTCSQFEYHWRAGLGLELPKLELVRPAFAMVNLLGEGHPHLKLDRSPVGHLHWYGKRENRPGRKLGHITVLGRTPTSALRQALQWQTRFQL